MKTGYLCHACGNEKCCNPEHLYWGTARDNSLDRYEHNPGIGKKVANTILSNDPDFYKKIGSHQGNKGVPKSDKHKKAISEGLLKHHADVTQR